MGHTVRFNYLDGRSFVEKIQLLKEIYVYPQQWGDVYLNDLGFRSNEMLYSQPQQTRFRLRTFQFVSRYNPKETEVKHSVPKWATCERDDSGFESLWIARWYEYFEMIDPRRLSKYVTLDELYQCISILRNTREIDEKSMLEAELTYLQKREKELKQNQERQVEIDSIMIERKL